MDQLKQMALQALSGGWTKQNIITEIWGYDGSDYSEGLEIWVELRLP